MQYQEVMQRLKALSQPSIRDGQARYGIETTSAWGVRMPDVRNLAKEIGRDHELAAQLWASGVHEARILATLVEDPRLVTEDQMDAWATDFNSWDLCDQCCGNLFDKTSFAYAKAAAWSERPEEYVKRAGFSLMAQLAVHDKKAADETFLGFLPVIEREASDGRNFVRKAVNWALRSIGKRNAGLREAAITTARRIAEKGDKSARWVAADALRELTSDPVQHSEKPRQG